MHKQLWGIYRFEKTLNPWSCPWWNVYIKIDFYNYLIFKKGRKLGIVFENKNSVNSFQKCLYFFSEWLSRYVFLILQSKSHFLVDYFKWILVSICAYLIPCARIFERLPKNILEFVFSIIFCASQSHLRTGLIGTNKPEHPILAATGKSHNATSTIAWLQKDCCYCPVN